MILRESHIIPALKCGRAVLRSANSLMMNSTPAIWIYLKASTGWGICPGGRRGACRRGLPAEQRGHRQAGAFGGWPGLSRGTCWPIKLASPAPKPLSAGLPLVVLPGPLYRSSIFQRLVREGAIPRIGLAPLGTAQAQFVLARRSSQLPIAVNRVVFLLLCRADLLLLT